MLKRDGWAARTDGLLDMHEHMMRDADLPQDVKTEFAQTWLSKHLQEIADICNCDVLALKDNPHRMIFGALKHCRVPHDDKIVFVKAAERTIAMGRIHEISPAES